MDKRNDSLTTHEIIERLIKSNEAMLHAAKTAQFEFIEVPGGLIARPTAPESLVNSLKRARELVQDILNCPRLLDQATVPRGGIEAAPQQVVWNISCSHERIKRMEEFLK